MKVTLAALALTIISSVCSKQPIAKHRPLPSLREQDRLEHGWVKKRYEHIPKILEKHGYDAWIVTQREYAEDTAFKALVSSTSTFSARRRTLFMFHTNPNVTSPFHYVSLKEDLWEELANVLEAVDPKRIAINHTGEGELLKSKLPAKYASRLSSHRAIGVEVIANRAGGEEQLEMYRLLMENVWAMIQEGFSERVIEVGKMTPEDLEWWFRDYMRWTIGTGTWFPPSVTIHRSAHEPDDPYFREGDMIHVDIGITAMNMNTDTQHLAYILRSNETAPPKSLLKGLRDANKMQDLNRKAMVPGTTGDDVFFRIKQQMKEKGLKGKIYSHPIGDYGHSAGAVIGMQDWQGAIPGGGQNLVLENYWTSVELSGETYVPEWNKTEIFELEEDIYWDPKSKTFEWVYGQQTEFHIINPRNRHPSSWVGQLATALGWNVVRWM